MNYSEILQSGKPVSRKTTIALIVLAASWIIAASAQVSIHLPFSPVPVSGQTLAVLLTGWFLGRRWGTLAVAAYLAQGAVGLPFFAGGRSGFAVLLGPTGGYLVGFLAAAYLVGMLSELHQRKSPFQAAGAFLLGNLAIYGFGLIWLVRFVGESQVLQLGLYPFLVGDLVKIVLGIGLVSGGNMVSGYLNSGKDQML